MLKPYVDALTEVADEATRQLYALVEKDGHPLKGKYLLQVQPAGGWSLENVEGLKKTVSALREEAEPLKGDKAKLEKQVEELTKRLEDLGNKDTDLKKRLEQEREHLKKQLAEQHEKEVGTFKRQVDELSSEVSRLLIDVKATDALQKAGAGKRAHVLLPHIRQMTRVKREETAEGSIKFTAEILDGDGHARIGDAQGNPFTFDQLAAEMKSSDDFSPFFEGTNQRGTETNPNTQRRSAGGDSANMTPLQRVEAGLAARKV